MPRTDLPQIREAFDQELGERAWTTMDLVRATVSSDYPKALDRDTAAKAIAGERWPDRRTRSRLERAVGWDPGWIQRLREGVTLDRLKAARGDAVSRVRLRDPRSHSLAEATDEEIDAEKLRRVTSE